MKRFAPSLLLLTACLSGGSALADDFCTPPTLKAALTRSGQANLDALAKEEQPVQEQLRQINAKIRDSRNPAASQIGQADMQKVMQLNRQQRDITTRRLIELNQQDQTAALADLMSMAELLKAGMQSWVARHGSIAGFTLDGMALDNRSRARMDLLLKTMKAYHQIDPSGRDNLRAQLKNLIDEQSVRSLRQPLGLEDE